MKYDVDAVRTRMDAEIKRLQVVLDALTANRDVVKRFEGDETPPAPRTRKVRKSPRTRAVQPRTNTAKILDVLTDIPQHVRIITDRVKVPRTSVPSLLTQLRARGFAENSKEGWRRSGQVQQTSEGGFTLK